MSRMGEFALERGEEIQKAFPEKSWEECMRLVMNTSILLHRNCAYVDGSFNPATGVYGGGGIIFDQNGQISTFTTDGRLPNKVESRNVAGEIEAVLYCLWMVFDQLRMDEITIYHDYEGIQKWADGEWATNKDLTRHYTETINKLRGSGKIIRFEKVKAHSKDYWNDEADRLAKEACGLW